MSAAERDEVLRTRQSRQLPWHSPPHYSHEAGLYHLTAACYEHRSIIGHSPARMTAFERDLLETLGRNCAAVFAWTVLPNHYHALAKCGDLEQLLDDLGRLHGRTSYTWNGEENQRGRQVWYRAAETGMKSERHFWATYLYVLHNAVKHGYVSRWQDWPFCNAMAFLAAVGRERAMELWREYPIDEYGADWDPAEL
jgi:putative transposase